MIADAFNNGGGAGATLKNNITVDATNGGTLSAVSSGFSLPIRLTGALSGSGPLSVTNNGVEFRGDLSGYSGTLTATGGTITFNLYDPDGHLLEIITRPYGAWGKW